MGEEVKDGTESFITVSSDMPIVEAPQDDNTKELANSEALTTEGTEGDKNAKQDTGEEAAAEQTDDKAKPSGKGVQKRFNELTRQREEQKLRADVAERKLADMEKESTSVSAGKEPVESDFKTYDEYLDAAEAHEAKLNSTEGKKLDQQKPPAQQKSEESDNTGLSDPQKVAMAVIGDVIDRNGNLPSDFKEVALADDVPINGTMLEALAECDDPARVMYHLGKNKELSAEIAGKTPAQQAREIAKLDISAAAMMPKPVKTTNAPDPVDPVGNSDTGVKDVNDMSFAEYEAYANKKERKG